MQANRNSSCRGQPGFPARGVPQYIRAEIDREGARPKPQASYGDGVARAPQGWAKFAHSPSLPLRLHLPPVRPDVRADDPARGADHARPEGAHEHSVGPVVRAQDGLMVAQLTRHRVRAHAGDRMLSSVMGRSRSRGGGALSLSCRLATAGAGLRITADAPPHRGGSQHVETGSVVRACFCLGGDE